jgi:hypothetical protein
MEESETFWEPQEGEALVPAVEPADVKAAWQVYHDAEVRMPGQQVAIGRSVFEHVCSPGADISSVTYRTVQLLLLFHIAAEVSTSRTRVKSWSGSTATSWTDYLK